MDPVILAAVDVDNAFHRDFSTNAVFIIVVSGGNISHGDFRSRSAAGAGTLAFSEGAEIGEPPDSSPPTTPQPDYIRQPTARSTRLIARHAVSSAVPASAVLTTAAPASACLLYTSPSPRDRQKSRMPSSA